MSAIPSSELILNPNGSIYHLHLKSEQLSDTIITVGDPDRVPQISQYFEHIEFDQQKREFRTVTGTYKNKRLTVISTGIGTDNIDIVMNELDALVNIDFASRSIREKHTTLRFIRWMLYYIFIKVNLLESLLWNWIFVPSHNGQMLAVYLILLLRIKNFYHIWMLQK